MAFTTECRRKRAKSSEYNYQRIL